MFVKLPVAKGFVDDFVHVNPAHVVEINERTVPNECTIVMATGVRTVIALSPDDCAARLDA